MRITIFPVYLHYLHRPPPINHLVASRLSVDPPPDHGPKVNSSLMLCHTAYILHLTSSHHVGILSLITAKRVSIYSTMEYSERGNHIHTTVIAIDSYICPV